MATTRVSRNISLTPELDGFVENCLASGDYGNASEVIRTALKLLRGQAASGQAASGRPRKQSLQPAVPRADWPLGGGECGALIRQRNWQAEAIGPVHLWSATLRTTVSNIVNSPVAKVLMWGEDHILLYNDSFVQINGDGHPAALGQPAASMFPKFWDWNRPIVQAGLKGESVAHREQPVVFYRPEGRETRILDLDYTPVYEDNGRVGGVLCTMLDNTNRVAAERKLAAREAELRRITDAVPMLIAYVDGNYTYRFANSAHRDWFGFSPDDMTGKPMPEVLGEEFFREWHALVDRALAGEAFTLEALTTRRDGTKRRCEVRYIPDTEPDGRVAGTHILAIDIEERAEREAALAASNRRFRTAMDAVHGVLWTNSRDGQMLGEQAGWAGLTGQTINEYQGYGWMNAVHPADREPTLAAWERAVEQKSMFVFEHRVRQKNGAWRNFAIRGLPILDAKGEFLEWVGVHTDITHQRAAEAALREQAANLTLEVRQREAAEEKLRQLNEGLEARVIAETDERRRAEIKLAQAQKMETIGQLTGGVAHDFNNLLQIISGNLQLLSKDVEGRPDAEQRLANAMSGVSRGSKLASQLLAFGRRQPLEPKVVDITRFVRGMDDLFRRALGEGIEVETIVGGGLWNTFIDPAQIENALLNLAINARDAMDGQGKLTIELVNANLDDRYSSRHDDVEPGQYVMLAVSDTGCGIPAEIIDRVFEPFFSTKSEGRGSGLGLSMVYGFVKQSGGHVKIYSEPGEGTTIRLYLPRAVQVEDIDVSEAEGPVTGGNETILVVEDDPEVRATVVEMLNDLGYRVLEAVDAASALNVIESGVHVDLLFSDVVMPGTLKSPEMARKARQLLPNMAVLFTSGYTENSVVHGGKLDAGVELLSKPYTREALARKMRHVLANPQQLPAGENQSLVDAKQAGTALGLAPGGADASRATILVVEDDDAIRLMTAAMLRELGYIVIDAANVEQAMIALQRFPIDCLVTDVNLPGLSGLVIAEKARALRPAIAVVYATGDGAQTEQKPDAVTLLKPYQQRALAAAIAKAMTRRQSETIAPAEREAQGNFSRSILVQIESPGSS